jgi:hypothetical protein
MKKHVNGEDIEMTAAEISELQSVQAEKAEQENQYKTQNENYETLKASAKAKLIAGEALTEEEANTIVL